MTPKQRQLTAATATVIAALVIITMLCLSVITGASHRTLTDTPPADSTELLMAGEFVETMPSESASSVSSAEPATSSITPEASPTFAESDISSNRRSAMKTDSVKRPTADQIKQQQQAQHIAGRMSAFTTNQSSTDNTQPKDGEGISNGSTGTVAGAEGVLEGRTMAHWVKPNRTAPDGRVSVRVTVDPQGSVLKATIASKSGSAGASQAVLQACIEAASKCRFSVKTDAPIRQQGTITYRFVKR